MCRGRSSFPYTILSLAAETKTLNTKHAKQLESAAGSRLRSVRFSLSPHCRLHYEQWLPTMAVVMTGTV